MDKQEIVSKWKIKNVQHLTIQSTCHNEEAAEDSSVVLQVGINVGVKSELAPHGRETIYSIANKMGFSGIMIPLLQL